MRQTRRVLVLVLLLLTLGAAPAWAEGRRGGRLGVGLILGEPTGLTGELRLGSRNAIDAAFGIDALEGGGAYVHADFLLLLPDLLRGGAVALSPYLGVGALVFGGDVHVGGRVPFGLALEFRTAPLQLFLEVAPRLVLVPDVDLGIGGALGFRYYF